MPLEFALRPRFRLHDSVAPPRRSRPKLPRVVLPIAAYWLGMAALTHAVIVAGKGGEAEPEESVEPFQDQGAFVAPSEPAPPVEPTLPEPALEAVALPPLPEHATETVVEPARQEPLERLVAAALDERPEPGTVRPEPDRAERRVVEPIEVPFLRQPVARAEPREAPPPLLREPPIARAVVPPREPSPPPPPREERPVTSNLPSCEAIIDSSSQDIDVTARDRTPDLPREAFSRVLDHGAYLAGCSVPERTSLEICVAVQGGRARGVSVVARPASAGISACVANAVARLRFPYSKRLDVARTRFEAAR